MTHNFNLAPFGLFCEFGLWQPQNPIAFILQELILTHIFGLYLIRSMPVGSIALNHQSMIGQNEVANKSAKSNLFVIGYAKFFQYVGSDKLNTCSWGSAILATKFYTNPAWINLKLLTTIQANLSYFRFPLGIIGAKHWVIKPGAFDRAINLFFDKMLAHKKNFTATLTNGFNLPLLVVLTLSYMGAKALFGTKLGFWIVSCFRQKRFRTNNTDDRDTRSLETLFAAKDVVHSSPVALRHFNGVATGLTGVHGHLEPRKKGDPHRLALAVLVSRQHPLNPWGSRKIKNPPIGLSCLDSDDIIAQKFLEPKPISVPWQDEKVNGCRALQGVIISRGEYLGVKYWTVK
jgi:hypothetical protein